MKKLFSNNKYIHALALAISAIVAGGPHTSLAMSPTISAAQLFHTNLNRFKDALSQESKKINDTLKILNTKKNQLLTLYQKLFVSFNVKLSENAKLAELLKTNWTQEEIHLTSDNFYINLLGDLESLVKLGCGTETLQTYKKARDIHENREKICEKIRINACQMQKKGLKPEAIKINLSKEFQQCDNLLNEYGTFLGQANEYANTCDKIINFIEEQDFDKAKETLLSLNVNRSRSLYFASQLLDCAIQATTLLQETSNKISNMSKFCNKIIHDSTCLGWSFELEKATKKFNIFINTIKKLDDKNLLLESYEPLNSLLEIINTLINSIENIKNKINLGSANYHPRVKIRNNKKIYEPQKLSMFLVETNKNTINNDKKTELTEILYRNYPTIFDGFLKKYGKRLKWLNFDLKQCRNILCDRHQTIWNKWQQCPICKKNIGNVGNPGRITQHLNSCNICKKNQPSNFYTLPARIDLLKIEEEHHCKRLACIKNSTFFGLFSCSESLDKTIYHRGFEPEGKLMQNGLINNKIYNVSDFFVEFLTNQNNNTDKKDWANKFQNANTVQANKPDSENNKEYIFTNTLDLGELPYKIISTENDNFIVIFIKNPNLCSNSCNSIYAIRIILAKP